DIDSLLNQLTLRINLQTKIRDLSVGFQQRVEILKLLYRGADLLILDEPTAVLAPQETWELFQTLRSLKAQGKTVIFISHKLREVLEIADRITVMRDGKVVGVVESPLPSIENLARMMVGREVVHPSPQGERRYDEILKVEEVETREGARRELKGLSFSLKAGEILGIAGVEGNGQADLVEVLAGLKIPFKGAIFLKGHEITHLSPRARREMGIACIPDDRQVKGLILDQTIADNLILGKHHASDVTGKLFLNIQHIREEAQRVIEQFQIRPSALDMPVRRLSGGNQQKVVLAREMNRSPLILIAFQPTRGLDIGATEFIHAQLIEMRNRGGAVLLISADLEEILALSDRVAVMYEGRIMRILSRSEAKEEEIGLLMAGMTR
ncbi:MAG: ATP-binding cassette domain-containing protein, partial [Candidatus Tectomicrobia bacterium]|nr:ATP-binding cassette domain-containing protein [Candidatus Tectomicrobia bacterium]